MKAAYAPGAGRARRTALLTALAGAVLIAAATPSAAADIRAGKALVAANCGGCHAIGGTGASPNPQAPPFREVMTRYPAADLEESLAEGIVTGHNDMPEFELDPDAIADVVAYMDALAVVTGDDAP